MIGPVRKSSDTAIPPQTSGSDNNPETGGLAGQHTPAGNVHSRFVSAASALIPIAAWNDAGWETPENAVETLM